MGSEMCIRDSFKDGLHRPQAAQDEVGGHGLAGVAHEDVEQLGLGRRQGDLVAVDGGTLIGEADCQALVDDGLGAQGIGCLLYTSDAADERSSVDLGGRRIIKKKMT